jgi:hypothetical protein
MAWSSSISPTARNAEDVAAQLGRYRRHKVAWALIFVLLMIPIILLIMWLDVGEINGDVLYSLLAFLVATAALSAGAFRVAWQSWRGVLVGEELRRNILFLVFRTDSGRTHRLRASGSMSAYYMPGDRVVKIKGFDYPEKEQRDAEWRICIVCGTVYVVDRDACPLCRAPAWDIWALGWGSARSW